MKTVNIKIYLGLTSDDDREGKYLVRILTFEDNFFELNKIEARTLAERRLDQYLARIKQNALEYIEARFKE